MSEWQKYALAVIGGAAFFLIAVLVSWIVAVLATLALGGLWYFFMAETGEM